MKPKTITSISGEIMKSKIKEKITNLYVAINNMMAELGAEGEINTRHPLVDGVMDALAEIDDGVYDSDRIFKSNWRENQIVKNSGAEPVLIKTIGGDIRCNPVMCKFFKRNTSGNKCIKYNKQLKEINGSCIARCQEVNNV